ncbi:MAG TPA: ACP S-malonyltransferase [Acidimicrobiales bacterium]|nr:ACP S-malonyltransferase [Acidimicrobiales bacterium]
MLAFTFPGQGSQRPGMGRSWNDHPSWEVVDEASDISGRDLSRLLLEADQAELTRTANAQLTTYVASLVALDAIERMGIAPTICAGHSLGEYSALTASGALAFEDGIRLVVERGDAMHDAAESRRGTMAAVLGADDDAVDAACQRAEGEVWVANYNAPGQVVIAGEPDALSRAGDIVKTAGARKVIALPVAGAFHTPLMAPARARLRKALSDTPFAALDVPVVANVDGRVHAEAGDWPGLLSAQLCSPVRWRQTLSALDELGATAVVEVGTGGVLTGLARRVLPDARSLSIATPDDLQALVDAISGSETWHTFAAAHQGEHLYTSERVVVSPDNGVFTPEPSVDAPAPGGGGPQPGGAAAAVDTDTGAAAGSDVAVGDLLGLVGNAEVRTPFAGRIVGFLVHPGERVTAGQPVAWLRVRA